MQHVVTRARRAVAERAARRVQRSAENYDRRPERERGEQSRPNRGSQAHVCTKATTRLTPAGQVNTWPCKGITGLLSADH